MSSTPHLDKILRLTAAMPHGPDGKFITPGTGGSKGQQSLFARGKPVSKAQRARNQANTNAKYADEDANLRSGGTATIRTKKKTAPAKTKTLDEPTKENLRMKALGVTDEIPEIEVETPEDQDFNEAVSRIGYFEVSEMNKPEVETLLDHVVSLPGYVPPDRPNAIPRSGKKALSSLEKDLRGVLGS